MTRTASLSFMRQLCHLRWLAVAGQALTVAVVVGPLHVALPTGLLCAGIAALAVFNAYVTWRVRRGGDASDLEVFLHMLADILELGWLVSLSGGMQNPFASLFLIPIALAILALPRRLIGLTALASVATYLVSTLLGRELPLVAGMAGGMYGLHMSGMVANFIVSAAVILFFFTRVAAAWRRSEHEVARLRERFARDEGIVALATHAAAVAHELNTPLGTLTLMVDDMCEDWADAATPGLKQNLAQLKSLLELCRDRVQALAAPAGSGFGDGGFAPVELDDVIQQWRLVRPAIDLHRSGSMQCAAAIDPAVGHLLQALLNNAADASERAGVSRVDLHLDSGPWGLHGQIRDYGVGFDDAQPPLPAELFRTSKPGGLGLGLALSHATVERLGGRLSMQATGGRGICVEFSLPPAA
ncbi:MAG TPA: ATP-binding protein [Steroidobacteraceae bacterium]|nr:ATP-binding protein [Steroidobacteraceae bacterium]